jgi:hypothetical protein
VVQWSIQKLRDQRLGSHVSWCSTSWETPLEDLRDHIRKMRAHLLNARDRAVRIMDARALAVIDKCLEDVDKLARNISDAYPELSGDEDKD